jgi:hypothetical protein
MARGGRIFRVGPVGRPNIMESRDSIAEYELGYIVGNCLNNSSNI